MKLPPATPPLPGVPYPLTRDKVFICYSHEDESWLRRWTLQLEPFADDGVVDLCVDTRIEAGERWLEEIRRAIDATR